MACSITNRSVKGRGWAAEVRQPGVTGFNKADSYRQSGPEMKSEPAFEIDLKPLCRNG